MGFNKQLINNFHSRKSNEENDGYDYTSIYLSHGYSSGFVSNIGPSLEDEENIFYDDEY